MEKLHFTITIDAPVETVWNTMLGDETYRQWTVPFNEGSYYQGDWSPGSKILFLGPNPDGSGEGGMVARIADNRQYEFISIEHLGMIANGVEDTTSDEVKKWTPAFENYTFVNNGDTTEVRIDMDSNEEYSVMFSEMWPRALQKLKDLAESAV